MRTLLLLAVVPVASGKQVTISSVRYVRISKNSAVANLMAKAYRDRDCNAVLIIIIRQKVQ